MNKLSLSRNWWTFFWEKFNLAEYVEVTNVSVNGLLTIKLKKELPEARNQSLSKLLQLIPSKQKKLSVA